MANIKELSARPDELAPGHRLCGGCGASMAVRQVLMGSNDYDVVCASATGCLEVSTTIFPDNAWNVPFIHNAFANAGATISGVEAAYKGLQRAGKIPADRKIKFVPSVATAARTTLVFSLCPARWSAARMSCMSAMTMVRI